MRWLPRTTAKGRRVGLSAVTIIRSALVLLALIVIVGCDQSHVFDRFVSKEEAEIARNYLSLLRDKRFQEIEDRLSPALKTPKTEATLVAMSELFPEGEPRRVDIVGFESFIQGDVARYNVTFQDEFPNQWLLKNVAFEKRGSGITIVGMNVQPLPDSLEMISRFALDGKTPVHYALLLGAVAVVALILFALVAAIRTPIRKRKWLWILFIICGVAQFSLNWTTGAWAVNPLFISLMGAGFSKGGPYAPWIVSISIPLGAIVFLFRRRRLAQAPPITI